ncbi:MAG: hypothetical protein RLZZ436_1012 [Planctomycetota bacterium]
MYAGETTPPGKSRPSDREAGLESAVPTGRHPVPERQQTEKWNAKNSSPPQFGSRDLSEAAPTPEIQQANTSSGRQMPLTGPALYWPPRSSARKPAPNQSAHATTAPTCSRTTSSGGIGKPVDTGLQTTDPGKNGFVGRLPLTEVRSMAKFHQCHMTITPRSHAQIPDCPSKPRCRNHFDPGVFSCAIRDIPPKRVT